MTETLFCDTECYPGYWLVAFKRLSDGQVLTMELSDRSGLDVERLKRIMARNRIVTFNGLGYDLPMIYYAISGASNAALKSASDRIIKGGVRHWQAEKLLGITIPAIDHIDLMEPNPAVRQSLKTLNGRLHGERMQDLPFDPDTAPTHHEMDVLTAYCLNDLAATETLFHALKEPLALRAALGKVHGMDFRSKSDSQIGEALVKKRVEEITGKRVQKVDTPAGTTFRYEVPDFLHFEHPELAEIVARLRATEFVVQADGKVDLPKWLNGKKITIGETTYAMGIGGLHSTEANRAIVADDGELLQDFDVKSYYPAIIINSGLFPKSLGPAFREVYRAVRDDRVRAKDRASYLEKLVERTVEMLRELTEQKTAAEGGKIQANGVFGKLGSIFSVLFAPHLLIYTTLTGQLALLMLIAWAEAEGISVVSGNTDGVVFHCPADRADDLLAITRKWENATGFELESTQYQALYSASVNHYVAIKMDGKAKRKGPIANPWRDKDLRGQMMKNPQATICGDAAVDFLTKGTPIEQTIRASRDIRDFVTVINVKGGGAWQGEYLGKVVRYVWALGGAPIYYKEAHASTGNHKKVPKTDGCKPLMDLPEEFPDDIDYERYIQEARTILGELGAGARRQVFLTKTKARAYLTALCCCDL